MSYQNQPTFIEDHIHRRFTILKKVGSGAYGHVWKVEQKLTKKIFALKKIFDGFQHATDAQRTYRQIEILRQIEHTNIIKLYDTIKADNNRDVYLLFQFVEADLHNVIAESILKDVHVRYIIYQIAKALKYLHSGKVIHRDLKPSNILVNSNCSIKLCDFGLVRSLAKGKSQGAVLTEGVATRWYRSPEVLLGSKSYSTPADIWSFGCIIYEILAQKPLFSGNSTLDQIQKVCAFTGYPSEQDINSLQSEVSRSLIKEMKMSSNTKPASVLKDFDPGYIDLLQKMLMFNPSKRMSIDDILAHDLLKSFRKIEDEIVCPKEISTSIDDNKKFSVDEYRKLVYGISYVEPTKLKSSSLGSLGTGSASPKFQQQLNKTTVNFAPTKTQYKPELFKKYSYDQNKFNPNYSQSSKKLPQKQNVRYTRSSNNLSKGYDGFPQTAQYKKQQAINNDVPNREEVDSHNYPNTSIHDQSNVQNVSQFPKYPQKNLQIETHKYSPSNHVNMNSSINGTTNTLTPQASMNWKPRAVLTPTILSANEIKEKILQFRSQKYLNEAKGNMTLTKTSSSVLQDTKKGL